MRLLVTGGAGFIGSNFLQLAAAGELEINPTSITVLDSLTYAGNLANIKNLIGANAINFIQGDICDEELVRELVADCDVVINFAAESHVDNSIQNATEFIRTNVLGTQTLLNACLMKGGIRFLQVSTDEVYGSIEVGSWDENCNLSPNSPYSASKAASDLIALAMHKTHDMDVMVSRCCNNYGPRQHIEKLIPKLIELSISNKPLTLYGNGRNIREWIHVNDHCKMLSTLINQGKSGEVYNIGSGLELQNIEVANLVLELIVESNSKISFIEDRKGHDLRYSVNDNKIRQLKFFESTNFEQGILDTIAWYKHQLTDNNPRI
jgi:dTDP-glucose 4,6-dehydratase